jgi:hypothetical protein
MEGKYPIDATMGSDTRLQHKGLPLVLIRLLA